MVDLHGRVIAILGGSRGIGLAIAERLAESGARVALGARTGKELESALTSLRAKGPGPHGAWICDVRETRSIETFLTSCRADLGEPYGLVAAVGVYGEIGPFLESSLDAWEDSL